ncbi:MAG: alpha/beta hydrolase [Deltaproteobacteria bacterium]|nr:alpha/beta hydrolase [Deltaproteobacteria bacterium]
MPFANLGDLNFYYDIAGEGPRLLYLGLTGDDLRQSPNIFDSPLPRHFTVLALDQRGLGQSARPDWPYSMAGYADDAAGLLAAVGWPSARVLGVSFGGMVAQELALRHPEQVERLALACCSSGGFGGASYPLHELAGLTPAERARRMVELDDSRRDAAWQEAHPGEFQALVDRFLTRWQVGAGEPGRAVGVRRQLEARQLHDTYNRLPEIKAPTLVCGGRYDLICPPDNLAALARSIPGAELQVFEGGHLFLQHDPVAYPEVIRFLAG